MKKTILSLLFVLGTVAVAGSFGNSTVPPGTGALTFLRNGITTIVSEDTGTPANSRPLPVELAGAGLGAVNQGSSGSSADPWYVRPCDGTNCQSFLATGEAKTSITQPLPAGTNNLGSLTDITGTISLPTGASTEATLSALNAKIPSQGQALSAASIPVVIASDQSPIAVTGTFSNPSVGTTGNPIPLSATLSGAEDGSGNLQNLHVDGSNYLNVNVQVSALPSGASTSANQSTEITSLGNIDTSTSSINTKIPSGLTVTSTRLLVDGSGVTQPISATALPLPAGAATSANQSTEITALGTINTTLGSPFQAGGSIGNTSFGATQATAANLNATVVTTGGVTIAKDSSLSTINTTLGTPMQNSGGTVTVTQATGTNLHTVLDSGTISTITNPVQTKDAVNTAGSGSSAGATVSTVTTLTAPANAIGFILMNLDTSTANIRWAVGRTASTTLGQQLQPGRDTGVVPSGANISIIAESGTQNYDVQWISQ